MYPNKNSQRPSCSQAIKKDSSNTIQNAGDNNYKTDFNDCNNSRHNDSETEESCPAKRNKSSSMKDTQKINKENWHIIERAKTLSDTTYLRSSFRNALIYLLFLLCLTFVAYGMFNSWMYWYTQLITNLFIHNSFPSDQLTTKTYPQIITYQDFWQYTGTILPRNFWYDLYPDDILEDVPITERHNMRNVMIENKLIGLPRIRQLRVRNDSCEAHTDVAELFRRCYGPFSESNEDTRSFGERSGTAWSYPPDNSVYDSDYYTGHVGSYPYTGFYQDLPAKHDDFIDTLNELRTQKWITRATRAVFIDFSMYNANINLFSFVKLVLEWPPVGGIIPSWEIGSFRLIRYVQIMDFVLFLFELILFLVLIYFTIKEFYKYRKYTRYLRSVWNCINMLLILFGWLFLVVYFYRLIISESHLISLIRTKNQFAKFYSLMWAEECLNSLMIVILLLAWIKLFQYLNLTRSTNFVYETVSDALPNLLTILFLFTVLLIALALCGLLLFGSQMASFSSFPMSITTIMRCALGGCSDLTLAPDYIELLFYLFTLGCFVIFGGLILASLIAAYLHTQRHDSHGMKPLIVEKEPCLKQEMLYSKNITPFKVEDRLTLMELNMASIDCKIDHIIARISHLQERVSELECYKNK